MTTPVPQPPAPGSLAPSLIRTLLPFLAGLIGTWLVEKFGVEVDTATVGALLTAGIGYAYYVAARFLEVFGSDRWGYILGFRSAPVYAPPAGDGDRGAVDLGGVGVGLAILGVIGLVVCLLSDAPGGVVVSAAVVLAGVVLAGVAGRNR